MSEQIDVVVRCKNEMPWTTETLDRLAAQRDVRVRVLFMDCGSTDGSREAAANRDIRIVDVDPTRYIPGAVLNDGMRRTTSEIVAFINADAFPVDERALADLILPFEDRAVAATYGRQIARPGADPLVALEYARAFGGHAEGPRLARGTFFSMAASAIRRSVWEAMPFDETLRYSEDVDWTARALSLGAAITYVPQARFEHSHDYDVRGQFRRRRGEGLADAAIYRLGGPSPIRDFARPLAGAVVRDARAGVMSKRALATRAAQAAGYFVGRAEAAGWL